MNAITQESNQHKDLLSDIYGERMLVTALTVWPEHLTQIMKIIPFDDIFQDQGSRYVYSALRELYIEKMEIRSLTVHGLIKKRGQGDIIKRDKISLSHTEMLPRGYEQIRDAAEGILSQYRRKVAREFAMKVNGQLYSDKINDTEIADYIYKAYEAMTLTGGTSFEKTSWDASKEALEDIDKAMRLYQSGEISGVSWGSKKLNEAVGGMQDDQVIVIAGRPGMGKTACAVDVALEAARSGVAVGYVSMEMPAKRIKYRMAARYTNIEYKRMRKGNISTAEYEQLMQALSDIGKLPIFYFDDTEIRNVKKLEAIATEWARIKGIGLLIIDYVQYLEDDNLNLTDTARVTKVSKSIKKLQRNLKIPIIGLAQLNRMSENRGDPRPKVSDLKDSGQLEQDASIVIGLFNPAFYTRMGMTIYDELNENPEQEFEENAYIYYVLKNRDGDVCRVDRYARLGTNTFSDYDDLGAKIPPVKTLTDIKNLEIKNNSFSY